MSSNGLGILSRFRSFFNLGNEDKSLKRRCEELPDYSVLAKYRRVNNEFPEVISRPLEDEITLNCKYNNHRIMSTNKSNGYVLKKKMYPGFADLEFSDGDDDDDINFSAYRPSNKPLATSSKNTTAFNNNERSQTDIIVNGVHTNHEREIEGAYRKPPLPPLIEKRTALLAKSTIPQLYPIKKSAQTNIPVGPKMSYSNDSMFQLRKPANMENMSYDCWANQLKNNRKINHKNLILQDNYNAKEKESYAQLIEKMLPGIYQTKNTQKLNIEDQPKINNVQGLNRRRRSQIIAVEPVGTINIVDDCELVPKETIDLSYDDVEIIESCDKSLAETRRQSSKENKTQLPSVVEPVNSLKSKFELVRCYRSDWLKKFQQHYATKDLHREKQISEEQKNASESEDERRKQEKLFSQRMQQMKISDAPVIVLDVEPEIEEIEFPELTREHIALIQRSVYQGPSDQVLISKFNINITRRDICTLVGDSWLNDEVINFYMNLLMERSDSRKSEGLPRIYAMNTFFIPKLLDAGYSGVRRWTRRVDLFSYDIIPVPVHVGMVHWCMAVIHLRNRTIKYYDSMGKANPKVLNALEQYLNDESMDKRKHSFDTSQFQKESVANAPRQMNGSDCGVFSCMFAEYITRNHEITFSQEHMPYFRQKMILEIVQGSLLL